MTRPIRAGVITVVVIAVVVAAVLGGRAIWHSLSSHLASDDCSVPHGYQVDTSQASVAAQMVGAVTAYRPQLPERAAVLALAAGLQESKLTNLAPGQGDR